jgi:hypothetical protein
LQEAAPHVTFVPAFLHFPEPSQPPTFPHALPSELHALTQQILPTQKPERQSLSDPQL